MMASPHLNAINHRGGSRGPPKGIGRGMGDATDDIEVLAMAKDGVVAVELWHRRFGDQELTARGLIAIAGGTENTGSVVR